MQTFASVEHKIIELFKKITTTFRKDNPMAEYDHF